LDLINFNKYKKQNKKSGAPVPNSMFEPNGTFSLNSKKIDEINYEESEDGDKIIITPNPNNKKYQLEIPKFELDENLNLSFNYQKSNIFNSAFDFKVFTSMMEIGSENLLNGSDEISFTLEDICLHLNMKPSTEAYNRIKNTIYNLKIKTLRIKISDSYEKIYNILTTIDKPVLNSERKLLWRVTLHEEIHKEILNAKYQDLITGKLALLKYELSILLLKSLIYDFEINKKDSIKYTWAEIAANTGLVGKPSIIKKRILASLDELSTFYGDIIENYETPEDNSYFIIYKKKQALLKSN